MGAAWTDASQGAIALVDKEVGCTSHDVVDQARRVLGCRKIGHTGTLDPFASGLLVLCVGRATRAARYLTGLDKRYEARVRLGVSTDTHDREGTSTGERALGDLTGEAIETALAGLRGRTEQVPPAFSAKKLQGERAYRKARRGEVVTLDPVPVEILQLQMAGYEPPELDLFVHCSSGTYVRAIARDLGDSLGVGAHLVRLRRTHVGHLSVADAVAVSDLAGGSGLRSAAEALAHLVAIDLGPVDWDAVRHGRSIEVSRAPADPVRALMDGALVAVGSIEDGRFRPRTVLRTD